MSHFSNTLTRLLSTVTQTDVSAASGIPRGTISLYASGSRGISVSALGKMLIAFGDPSDQADLIIAHLRDETPATHEQMVRIERTGEMIMREDPPQSRATRELDQAMELLRIRADEDDDLRRVLLDLEQLVR